MKYTAICRYIGLLIISFAIANAVNAQTNSGLLRNKWTAQWITVPGSNNSGYGVYLFRKQVNLASKPSSFVVHISADNRYKLYVNNHLVSLGPARGDALHWNYETVDIASSLTNGANIIAAEVWNEGEFRPEAQISLRTAFILQGDDATASAINTNNSWKCIRDSSYRAIPIYLPTFYVAGPGEEVDMKKHPAQWKTPAFNDTAWQQAAQLFNGTPKNTHGAYGSPNGWMLTPSPLPQMELTPIRFAEVRRSQAVNIPASFPKQKTTITIPANTTGSFLLDHGTLTNAYPTIVFGKGKNAGIGLTYAEGLFTKYPDKGNRNEIEGKQVIGRRDSIISDGTNGQQYTTLTWRTYRYVQVNIKTQDEALEIEDIQATFTGFPFQLKAKFESGQPLLQQIFDVGWRTARLCAVETYMDCPYYEQLQYIGDLRIQALVSFFNTGDERLIKSAINHIDHSKEPDGITLSRYPSANQQYIPPFSLWYIGMLHDYYRYGSDSNFLKDKLQGERSILAYFNRFQQRDGSLKEVPWWTFTDWVDSKWDNGIGPVGADGNSALLDLQLLWAYQVAAELEERLGMKAYELEYRNRAAKLAGTIRSKYFDSKRGLFADRSEKDVFSQHANALAILTGISKGAEATSIARKMLSDTSLAPASIYFKYYLHSALNKAGLANDYLQWLGKWKENIDMGLTTWAEISEISTARSDCHAWGSSPNIEFMRTVLGVDSDAPYFARVRIEPHTGELKNVSGDVPHANGKIHVELSDLDKSGLAQVILPQGLSGTFVWKGKRTALKPGKNSVKL